MNDAKDEAFPKAAVALGSFESMHAGHIKIIKNTVDCAKKHNLKSVVTIFRNPVLKNRDFVSETLDERLHIIEGLGTDITVIFDFDDNFKRIEYTEFFNNFIVEKFNANYVFTGFNYRFGRNAEGNTDNLRVLCEEKGIILDVTPPVSLGEIISSTYVHKLIENGDAEKLNEVLLRPYSVSGIVTKGRNIGHTFGFPTANLDFPKNKAIIKAGVYFGKVNHKFGMNYAIINVGLQPTVSDEYTPKIEVYLFNFHGNLYGSSIQISFLKRMRDIQKFADINELKKQLENDKKDAKHLMKNL